MTHSLAPPIRVLIVDDEPLARSNIRALLRRDPGIEIVRECGSGVEALEEIHSSRPDLVFLDVQMPECDGFDVLEQLGVERTPEIVFVTAYDRYALDAFEAGALDYLLKPFDNDRFELMLRRVKERIASRRQSPSRPQSLAIKSPGHLIFVKIVEIDWIEAANYYSCLHVGSTSHLLRRSINSLEADLEGHAFCRIHRSTIVNMERVREVELNAEGEHDVRLTDSTRLRVSRRYRAQLVARLRSISTESPNS